MQCRGEGIVDQLPVAALALERNARHVQFAIAGVTDGDGAFRSTAGLYPAEAQRSCNCELPRGHIARDGYFVRTGWIVTDHCKRSRLRTKAAGLKADRHG